MKSPSDFARIQILRKPLVLLLLLLLNTPIEARRENEVEAFESEEKYKRGRRIVNGLKKPKFF